MKRIEQYEKAKLNINNLIIKDLAEYEVGKILYADIWNMYGLSIIEKLKRIMALILCNPVHFFECSDSKASRNIALEIQYREHVQRIDNDTIYNNLYMYMKPSKHVVLKKKYVFQLSGCLKRLNRLIKYFRDIRNFSIAERFYLSAQLVMVKNLVEYLDKVKFFRNCRFLLIFQEYDTLSSTIIQNAHQYGVKVISPQHGMPMNRHENSDQLFFDGFLCDYKLVWNDFEKAQYLSAGIDANKIFVVGNTKTLHSSLCVNVEHMNSTIEKVVDRFGVLLNCPKVDKAFESNCKLLEAANLLAMKTGKKFYIKLHPIDSADKYGEIIKPELADVVGVSLREYQEQVQFSIAHITSAIFDLIYDGCFVFQYVMGEKYPVDLDAIYKFASPEELVANYMEWESNFPKYRVEYQDVVEKYYVKDAKDRHDIFFRQLLGENGIKLEE